MTPECPEGRWTHKHGSSQTAPYRVSGGECVVVVVGNYRIGAFCCDMPEIELQAGVGFASLGVLSSSGLICPAPERALTASPFVAPSEYPRGRRQ